MNDSAIECKTNQWNVLILFSIFKKPVIHNTKHVVSGFCCASSVPASCVHIWFVSCPCFMSLWVNSCPAVCMWLCVNYGVFSSCLLSSSGLFVTSRCILSVSLALSCLDVIKYYYLSLYPRLRVPVPHSCVHRDMFLYLSSLQVSTCVSLQHKSSHK